MIVSRKFPSFGGREVSFIAVLLVNCLNIYYIFFEIVRTILNFYNLPRRVSIFESILSLTAFKKIQENSHFVHFPSPIPKIIEVIFFEFIEFFTSKLFPKIATSPL